MTFLLCILGWALFAFTAFLLWGARKANRAWRKLYVAAGAAILVMGICERIQTGGLDSAAKEAALIAAWVGGGSIAIMSIIWAFVWAKERREILSNYKQYEEKENQK